MRRLHVWTATHVSRAICVVPLVLALSLGSLAAPARAASPLPHSHSFAPSGQGAAAARLVSTATTPQVAGTGQGAIPYRPAPGGRNRVPSPLNVVRVPAPLHQALRTIKTFTGQSENGWQPSDSNGTVGYSNYVETVNEQWAIYSRTGTQQYATDFNTWFGQSGSLFDPVVQWDKTGQRFMFVVNTGSGLLLSVAQQRSALGSYCNYSFGAPSGYFSDYEKLGVDADGVYLTVNLYGTPFTNELFFISRTALETCATAGYTYWTGLTNPDSSVAFAIVPARQDSASSGVEYLVNSNPGGACGLTLWSLTSSASLSNTSVGTQCYSPPPAAKQAGSAGTIDTGDNRLYQASYLNGLLTLNTVGAHDWGDGNGPVGIVEWFVLNASAGTVSSQGSFGTPGYWLFYPATITNSLGRKLFVYDASGPTIDPSIWFVNQSLSGVQALASGVSYYGTSGTARWGDYSSNWLDNTGNSVWITSQYANGTNTWGTAVGHVVP